MSKLGISTGTIPNDGFGDSLLDGAIKINSNFDEIYGAIGDGTNITNTIQYAGYATTAGIATYASSSGISTYSTSSGISTYASVSGIATYTSEWTLGVDGTSNFTFSGSGLTGAENDPTIYVIRGQQYKFTANLGAGHTFRIQTTANGSLGTQYNDGIVNNDLNSGTLTWDVQFDSPDTLYYQSVAYPNMGGVIRILSENASYASSAGVSTNVIGGISSVTQLVVSGNGNISGILTVGSGSSSFIISSTEVSVGSGVTINVSSGQVQATSFVGDGSGLSGVIASGIGITIRDGGGDLGVADIIDFGDNLSVTLSSGIATITGAAGGGGSSSQWVTTSAGIHTLSNVGIGTTNPTSKLTVSGDVSVSGVITSLNLNTTELTRANRILSPNSIIAPSNAVSKGSGSLRGSGTASVVSPIELAIDPTGRFAYFANYTSNTLSSHTIDQSTGVIVGVGTTTTGTTCVDVVADPSGRFVYATNYDSDTVGQYLINQSTGELTLIGVGTTASGNQPYGITADPTGRFVYVANNTDDNISQYSVNQTTGALTSLGTIAAENFPYKIVTDPSGRFVYVSNYLSNTIGCYSINQSTGSLTLLENLSTNAEPFYPAIDPTARFLYLGCQSSNVIEQYSINQSTGLLTLLGTVATSDSVLGIAIDPTGKFAYASIENSSQVSQYTINQITGLLTLVGTVSASSNVGSLAVDPTSRFLYAVDSNNNLTNQYSINTFSFGNIVASSVGIGTTNPTSTLEVKGNTSLETLNVSGVSAFIGNVGIGTTNPTEKLEVLGQILQRSDTGRVILRDGGSNTLESHIRPNSGSNGFLTFTEQSVADRWMVGIESGNDSLLFKTGNPETNTERLRIRDNGYVGIGTTNPTSALTVSGDGRFTGVVTATTFVGNFSGSITDATNLTGGYANASQLNVSGIATISQGRIQADAESNLRFGNLPAGSGSSGRNIAIGDQVLVTLSGGQGRNIGIGELSYYDTTTGQYNIAIGVQAGQKITTGSYNVIIGGYNGQTGLDLRTSSNNVVIADGQGNIRQYIDSNGNVGIKTTVVTEALTVAGVVSATSFYGTLNAGQLTGALPAIDGSALIGVVGSGSGVVIEDDATPVGTAGTINFGSNLNVSFASGIATVSGVSSVSEATTAYGLSGTPDLNVGVVTSTSFNGSLIGNVTGNVSGSSATSGYATTAGIASAVSSTININTTGIITASSFSGSGSGLTNIPSSQLSGALPAIDGSALLNVNATGDGVVVEDDSINVGSAKTINFGTGLDVEYSASGIATITASGGSLQSRTTVIGITPSIANNGIGNTNIAGFKSYALMKVGLSTAGWLRLYTDSASRDNDISRSIGEDPIPGNGVIAEVVTTGISTTQIISPFVMGGNLDDPADTTIYAAITNLSGSTQAITANLTILQLEA